jgi:carbonic anhydrase
MRRNEIGLVSPPGRRVALVALLTAFVSASGVGASPPSEPSNADPAHGPVHWGYGKDDGPAVWGDLSPAWEACARGRAQSPIDLAVAEERELEDVAFGYRPASLAIVHHEHVIDVLNNGHTIQVNYDEGSTIEIGGVGFELVQYHFHAPSEHTVGGRHFPMEMHLVHKSAAGELAVAGVLIDEGGHNAAFEPVWKHLPDEPGKLDHLEHVMVDIDELLPPDRRSYRYPGSLTTPPCSEGVRWLVFVEPVALSKEQIAAFRAIVHDNNRPVQPLEDRKVLIESTPLR